MSFKARDIEKVMLQEVKARLKPFGFKKRTTAVFTVPFGDDVIGWLGLNSALFNAPAVVETNPIVGVRFGSIYEIAQVWTGMKPHPYAGPMPATNIGYLVPGGKSRHWEFYDPDELDPPMSQMIGEIVEYGLPWMRHNSALERALPAMEDRSLWRGIPYELMVAYLRLGQSEKAVRLLNELEAKWHGDTRRGNPQLTQFRASLEHAIETGRSTLTLE